VLQPLLCEAHDVIVTATNAIKAIIKIAFFILWYLNCLFLWYFQAIHRGKTLKLVYGLIEGYRKEINKGNQNKYKKLKNAS
jgi:hypothetical protein